MRRNRPRGAAIRRGAAVPLLLLGLVPGAAAQRPAAAPWRELVIDSRALGRRTIDVAVPDGYERGSERYAVLVLLDAEERPMFRLGIAQAAYLAENADGVPPMIVVGVENGADRLHDLLPAPTGSSVAEFPTAGGARAFADFIAREVLPLVRARYRTLPTTVLAGFSAGGVFALYSAATWPGRYQGVIAMDPAIWYNDHRPAVEYADAIAASPARQRVFAGHHGVGDPDIDTTTQRFALRLDALRPPHVAFAHRRYPDDSHAMVPLSALPDGLRFVFAPVATQRLPMATLDARADSATVLRALAQSEASYADSARALLLPGRLPEPDVNRLARFALTTVKNADLAVLILRRNVELHPRSARATARLADGYLARGDTATAIAHLRQAIAMASTSDTELPPDARAKLERLIARK
jgi:uncharacterized protein